MNRGLIFAIISVVTLLLDYLSKKAVVEKLSLYEKINILPYLNIVYVENRGAAFGMLAGLGNKIFIFIGLAAVVFIVIYARKVSAKSEFYALALILGGAAGNLVDRFRIGKVIDFIDVYVNNWHWPAFNVADSALTVGIAMLIYNNLKHGWTSRSSGPSSG